MGTKVADTALDRGSLALESGRIVGLDGAPGSGFTRLGLSLAAARPGLVAVVDVRGWFCPLAAWETGLEPERMVVVRCPDPQRWPQVIAALVEGVRTIVAEIPAGVADPKLRRIAALVRSRRSALALRPLRGALPPGLSHLHLRAQKVTWDGPEAGHGRLRRRALAVEASGKATGGITRLFEMEDDGTHTLRMVPGLAVAPAGRVAG